MNYQQALDASGGLSRIARFDPRVVGTPPLGLDVPGSDIDVICHAPDLDEFAGCLTEELVEFEGFSLLAREGMSDEALAALLQ